MFSINSIVK